ILIRAKSNYARPGEEIELIFEDGGFKCIGGPAPPPRGHMRDSAADVKILELLPKNETQSKRGHESRNKSDRYAPKVFAADPDRGDFSAAEFKRAMIRLLSSKRIKLEWNSHRKSNMIVEVNQ